MAQSAGDEQYADPFGQTEEPSGSQGEEPSDTQGQEAAPAPEPAAPAQEQAVAHRTRRPPRCRAPGIPAHLLAGAGALLLAAGGTLRRLVL